MKLAVFLSIGDSLRNMENYGQLSKFINFYLNKYADSFEEIHLFTYASTEGVRLPKNVIVVTNKYKLHRYFYSILLPIMHYQILKRVDVIRVYHVTGCIPAILAKLLYGKRFIFNLAYDYYKFALIERHYVQAILFKLIEPISVIMAEKVFVANRRLLLKVPKSKAIYLPNGVDTNFFRPKPKTRRKTLKIISVGRLEYQKNYKSLIKAVQGLPIKLVIVGRGSLNSQLKKEADNNQLNVEFIDSIDHLDMPQLYNKADIFVLPSLIEGHPKVLLEAMSSGLAIVATRAEGIIGTFHNSKEGVFVNFDPNSIKAGIKKLINNPGLRVILSKGARIRVLKDFDLDKLMLKEIEVIKELA